MDTQQAIRAKLEEITECVYSDGTVKFNAEFCTPEEMANIGEWRFAGAASGYASAGTGKGMLDTLARIMAECVHSRT